VVGCLGRKLGIFSTAQWIEMYKRLRSLCANVWLDYVRNTNLYQTNEMEFQKEADKKGEEMGEEKVDADLRQREDLDRLIEGSMPRGWLRSHKPQNHEAMKEAEEQMIEKMMAPPKEAGSVHFVSPAMDDLLQLLNTKLKSLEEKEDEKGWFHLQRRDYDAVLDVELFDGYLYTCHFLLFGDHVCLTWKFGDPKGASRELRWISFSPTKLDLVLSCILKPLNWQPAEYHRQMGFHQPRSTRSTVAK